MAFLMCEGCIEAEKLKTPKQAHLGLLVNFHTKFQLIALIKRGNMDRKKLKNKKNRPKTVFLRLRGLRWG